MKKLVQLKNKENENLDPINLNYETRILNLENNTDKFIIEKVTLETNCTITSDDAKVWNVPSKNGYTTYVLKPIVVGSWSDKFAVYVPYDNTFGFGIKNTATVDYTWDIYCIVLYVKN